MGFFYCAFWVGPLPISMSLTVARASLVIKDLHLVDWHLCRCLYLVWHCWNLWCHNQQMQSVLHSRICVEKKKKICFIRCHYCWIYRYWTFLSVFIPLLLFVRNGANSQFNAAAKAKVDKLKEDWNGIFSFAPHKEWFCRSDIYNECKFWFYEDTGDSKLPETYKMEQLYISFLS